MWRAAACAVGHVQSLLEALRDRTECVGSVKKLAQDARELGALRWCPGGGVRVVDAQVAARVDGGEASLEVEPASREESVRRNDRQCSDASKPPSRRSAYVARYSDGACPGADLMASLEEERARADAGDGSWPRRRRCGDCCGWRRGRRYRGREHRRQRKGNVRGDRHTVETAARAWSCLSDVCRICSGAERRRSNARERNYVNSPAQAALLRAYR